MRYELIDALHLTLDHSTNWYQCDATMSTFCRFSSACCFDMVGAEMGLVTFSHETHNSSEARSF